MEDIIPQVLDSLSSSRQVSRGAQKLERVIVIRPAGTTEDIIETVSYVARHGDLQGYDLDKLNIIMDKKKEADRALSNAFKRVTLFEAAAYIGETFASELGGDDIAREIIPEILSAQTSLMGNIDCSRAYETITKAYGKLLDKRKSPLNVSGKVSGTYLFDLKQVLSLCSPERHQTVMNTGFAGRHIRFSIPEGGIYQAEVTSNPDFADFSKRWPHLLNPAIGRVVLESPETTDYANQFLDRFSRQYHTIEPAEVRFSNGRTLEEQFRIEDLNA